MNAGAYLLGIAVLAAMVVPLAVGAHRWRRCLLPHWGGAPAWLADVVLCLGGLLAIAGVLGAAGQFKRWPMVALCVLVGTGAAVVARPVDKRHTDRPALVAADKIAVAGALVVVAFAFAVYTLGTVVTLDAGPIDTDTQSYHLPYAARFVQTGSLTRIYYATPYDGTPYQPFDGEVVHAIGILAFGHDELSPFINLGWLLMALGAAWVIGRPWGVGPTTAALTGLVIATPAMMSANAGSAGVDVAGLALALTAAALLATERDRSAAVGLAATAGGLAVATKLSLLIPILGLTIALVLVQRKAGRRRRTFAIAWFLPLVLTGSYWYLRNLVRVGNPIPTLHLGLGILKLPSPPIRLVDRFGYSVADYLFDLKVWRYAFYPGLRYGLGVAWPVLGLIATLGVVKGIVVERDRLVRGFAVAALLSAVGYLVTPTTAGGLHGQPTLFVTGLRYVTPAFALAAVVAAISLADRSWARKWTPLAALVTAPFIVAIPTPWRAYERRVALAVALVVVLIAVLLAASRAPKPVLAATATAAVVAVLVGGLFVQKSYLTRRYTSKGRYAALTPRIADAYLWAQHVHGKKIGIAGFFVQYPLFGSDVSNEVDYVGDHRADGAFVDYTSCPSWRRAVNRGRYNYLVIMPGFPNDRTPLQLGWARGDPAAIEILRRPEASVFRVSGRFDPSSCERS